jgi:hypothetical protein
VSAAPASSRGPLIARLTRAVGGPSNFWGPWPFAPLRGHVCGPGSRGLLSVFWIPGYPGPPAPRPLQRPSFGPGEKRRPKPSREDPHEEAPHEENDSKTAKDQKTSSRAVSREGKDHIHVSSACFRAEQEDKSRRLRTVHATPDREETNFHRVCIKRHGPPP